MQGIKSMCFAFPISPIIDIVWSIPPQAVPAFRSEVIHRSASNYLGTLSMILFACIVVTAAQTTKAELELKPAAGGTWESIKIFKPTGLFTKLLMFSSRANIAL